MNLELTSTHLKAKGLTRTSPQELQVSTMAIITSGSTILVTGANGFIASWIIRDLLEGGYTVRGTVRTKDKIPHLTRLFKTGVDSGKFHIVVVEDITKASLCVFLRCKKAQTSRNI